MKKISFLLSEQRDFALEMKCISLKGIYAKTNLLKIVASSL